MNHTMYRLAAAGLVLAAGCTHHGGGPNPGASGRVRGHVMQSPTCPGPQHEGQVCTAPLAGAVVDAGTARATTDAAGAYELWFRGTMAMVTVIPPAGSTVTCPTVSVAVRVGGTVTQDFDCDTGIR
jgi:hypothetical protein